MAKNYTNESSIANDSSTSGGADDMASNFHAIYLKPVPWDWRWIAQVTVAIIGILGNSMVIHVYRNARSLQKATTNTLIAALAVADLTTSIAVLPFPRLSYVPDNFGGHFYCKIVDSVYVMWVSLVASVFTLTVLPLERFVAVVYPLRHKRMFTTTTMRKIVAAIWLSAIFFHSFFFYTNHRAIDGSGCVVEFLSEEFQMFIGVVAFLVKFLVPVIVMLTTNVLAIRRLQRQAESLAGSGVKNIPSSVRPQLNLLRAKRRVINMLLIVVITFIICWSPDQLAFFGFNLGIVPVSYLYIDLYLAFVLLAFINSAANPIIYALMNGNFRKALKEVFVPSALPSSKSNSNLSGKTSLTASGGSSMKNMEKTPAASYTNRAVIMDTGEVMAEVGNMNI